MKDYIFETTIKIIRRIPSNNESEALIKCKKQIKSDFEKGIFSYTPRTKDIRLIDIVKNRKENNIAGNDISIMKF